MDNFQLLTDGLCDLPPSWLKQYPNITVIDTPIIVNKGDDTVTLRNLTPADFDQVARYVDQGYSAHTSCPDIYMPDETEADAPENVESVTRKLLEQGRDVLYLTMSSTLSSTFSYVSTLYQELAKEYTERKIICVDSLSMSTGLGLLVMDIMERYTKGLFESIQDIAGFIEEARGGIAHVFSWSEFSFIRKSGRVSLLPAFLGSALHFQPFCSCEYDDRKDGSRVLLPVKSTVRGEEKFAQLVADFARETITDPESTIIVAHGNRQGFADQIAAKIKELLPKANILVGPQWRVSSGIQVHGGPTSVHINFHRKQPNSFTKTSELVKSL
ncbi:MAG: DegV family EDD domain-containing protein [Lachnospiraceae bacterium]|nr:DegV family EDD domain-containing protein [Lachnospiraceae bacterium]